MKDPACTTERELREELVDTLLAISLLSKRMAQNLAMLTETMNTEKGEHDHGQDERTGCCPYRIVHAG